MSLIPGYCHLRVKVTPKKRSRHSKQISNGKIDLKKETENAPGQSAEQEFDAVRDRRLFFGGSHCARDNRHAISLYHKTTANERRKMPNARFQFTFARDKLIARRIVIMGIVVRRKKFQIKNKILWQKVFIN
jgi:hypothetical protein